MFAGPWDSGDHLDDSGRVILYRAENQASTIVSRTLEDLSEYQTGTGGWPAVAEGYSLNRALRSDGSDGASWYAGAPTPGQVPLTYAYWSSFAFPAGGPQSADSADPDRDGLTNLMEYAFGTFPLTADAAAAAPAAILTPAPGGGQQLTFSYTRHTLRPGLSCTVQRSPNLQAWMDTADAPAAVSGVRETRSASVPVIPGARTYFRLRITVP